MRTLWIVCPVFFDVESFVILRARIAEEVGAMRDIASTRHLRFVVVDDAAGADPDVERLRALPDVTVVATPSNLGHQRAIVRGLRRLMPDVHPDDWIVTLDADGEDQPSDLPRLLGALADAPADSSPLALAWRTKRQESLPFKALYFVFTLMFRLLTGTVIRTGNYAALSGRLAAQLVFDPRLDLSYSSALVSLNVPTRLVPCERGRRYAGHSKMGYLKLIRHGYRMLLPFGDRIAPRAWTGATIAFIAIAALVAFTTCSQYGITWDEEHSMDQGLMLLRWYASGFTDRGLINEGNYWFYGGLFNAIAQVCHRVTGFGIYETSHVINVVFGLTGVAVAAWVAASIFNPMAGFFSAVFLWLTPVYYGHSFNNPKDLPFAAMGTVALAGIVSCWRHLPDVPRRVWIRTGLALGLALGIRVGGVLFCGYLALSWAGWLLLRAWPFTADRIGQAQKDARTLLLTGLKIAVIAWAIMVVFTPIMQARPLGGPWQLLRAAAHFPDMDGEVRFRGLDIPADRLPRSYAPVWFAITLPEFYAVAAVAGALALWWNRRSLGRADPRTIASLALLTAAALVPLASAIVLRSVLYDGIRHLIFIVPPLAILAGLAVAALVGGAGPSLAKVAVVVLIAASLAATAADMRALHPYEAIYFNRIVAGGLRGASPRFETDYWGLSYKEALDWVVAHYRIDAGVPIRLANCSEPFQTGYYLSKTADLRARYVPVEMEEHPDVVLATTRWDCHTKTQGRVVHVVERMGTPLCYVIEVARPTPARSGS